MFVQPSLSCCNLLRSVATVAINHAYHRIASLSSYHKLEKKTCQQQPVVEWSTQLAAHLSPMHSPTSTHKEIPGWRPCTRTRRARTTQRYYYGAFLPGVVAKFHMAPGSAREYQTSVTIQVGPEDSTRVAYGFYISRIN